MTLDPVRRRRIIRDAVGVGAAVGAYAISFGALGTTNGLSVMQTQILSLLLFSGASQFAVVSIVGAGGSPASAIASAALLGMRNGLYALRLSSVLQPRGWRRFVTAHVTIDESTAMGLAQERGEPDDRQAIATGFWATGLSVFVLWNTFTLVGALAAQHIADPKVFGLDAAIPAGFAALIAPRLTSSLTRWLAATCAVVAVGAATLVPPGVPVLIAASVALAVALATGKRHAAGGAVRVRRPEQHDHAGAVSPTRPEHLDTSTTQTPTDDDGTGAQS